METAKHMRLQNFVAPFLERTFVSRSTPHSAGLFSFAFSDLLSPLNGLSEWPVTKKFQIIKDLAMTWFAYITRLVNEKIKRILLYF